MMEPGASPARFAERGADNLGGATSVTSIIATVSLVGALLLVPFGEFRKLSPFGLVGGLAVGLGVFTLGGPVLRLWRFHDAATVAGIPVMLAFTWYPIEILFAYAFRLFSHWYQRAALVAGTALGATLVHSNLETRGIWEELVPINSIWIFTMSVIIHAVLVVYLWLHREEPRRSSIPPLR